MVTWLKPVLIFLCANADVARANPVADPSKVDAVRLLTCGIFLSSYWEIGFYQIRKRFLI